MRLINLVLTLGLLAPEGAISADETCQADKCLDQKNDPGVNIYSELTGLNQDDPSLIEAIRTKVLIHPDGKPLNLTSLPTPSRIAGQFGQTRDVEEVLQKYKLLKKKSKSNKKTKKGFFIEAGASCGEVISNSLYFELKHGWTGLLVEPNPDFIKKLKTKHRDAWILPHCLSTKPQVEIVEFDAALYNGGIIKEGKTMPSDLGRKTPRVNGKKLPHERTIKVQCFPLYSVLMALDNPQVNYFSLDIEGAEHAVLQTVPWDNVNINLLSVEMNHAGEIFEGTKADIHTLLATNGYDFIKTATIDDIFLKKTLMLP